MENNKDNKLDFVVDGDKKNGFGSDDDLESLLSSSSSAADALNALSYNKESRSLIGAEGSTGFSESDENMSESDSDDEKSSVVSYIEPHTTTDSLDITLTAGNNSTVSSSAPENIHNDAKLENTENTGASDKEISQKDINQEDIDSEKVDIKSEQDDNANETEDESQSETDLDASLPASAPVDAKTEQKKPSVSSKKPKSKSTVPNSTKKSKNGLSNGKKRTVKQKNKVNSSIFTGIIITIIILTISTVIAFTGITVGLEFLGIGKSSTTIKLNIDENYGVEEITDALYDKGIINNKFLFKLCVNIKDAADKIVPGDIELQPSMSYNDKINALMQSRQNFETVDITFPEGTTLYEAAKLLKKNDVISSITNFIYDFNSLKVGGYEYEDVIDAKGDKFFAMEGYFYPDTYQFYKDSDNETVIRTIREVFNTRINGEMRKRAEDLGYSIDEVITIASIVQLESANAEEMPTIASILKNRLEDGPYNRFGEYIARLQSDPTANYYTNTITSAVEELNNYTATEAAEFKTRYDTYEREGLPVGPICNPGLDAINAVLYPAETDYFYFCHDINTKKGYYASTLSEHEANLVTAGISQ